MSVHNGNVTFRKETISETLTEFPELDKRMTSVASDVTGSCSSERKFSSTMLTEYYEIPHQDEDVVYELSTQPSANNQYFTTCEKNPSSEENETQSIKRTSSLYSLEKLFAKKSELTQHDKTKQNSPSKKSFQQSIVWPNVAAFAFWHAVAIYGFFTTFHRVKLATMIWAFFIYICSDFGVVAGAHRLWSHRSYKVTQPMKLLLLFCYSMAGENSVHRWAKDHRIHHKFVETDSDPHNSNRGFIFAHFGWLMMKKHPDVIKKSATIDMSDITNDPVLAFHTKYFAYIKIIFCFILPALPPIYFWNENWLYSVIWLSFIRYLVALHAVFTINSFAHMWGYKPYDKRIKPSENWGVSLVVLGDGWHNYHHTFPWDYSAPERGNLGRFDLTASLLDLFRKIGWVYDVKRASPELIKKTMKRHGDGSKVFEVPIQQADDLNDKNK